MLSKKSRPGAEAVVTYTYENIRAGAGYTYAFGPQTISYAGRTITFQYIQGNLLDNRQSYRRGMTYVNALLLSNITMRVNSSVVRTYYFTPTIAPRTGRILFSDLTESTPVASSSRLLAHFDYARQNPQTAPFSASALDLPSFGYDDEQDKGEASFLTTDVTGDGIDDVLIQSENLTSWGLGKGRGRAASDTFGLGLTNTLYAPFLEDHINGPGFTVAIDYNQDGRSDFLMVDSQNASSTWQVLEPSFDAANHVSFQRIDTGVARPQYRASHTSMIDGFASAHLADVDGDGVSDLIQCNDTSTDDDAATTSWEIHYWGPTSGPGGGPGFSPTPALFTGVGTTLDHMPCGTDIFTVDIDGDHRVDLVFPKVTSSHGGKPASYGAHYFAVKADPNQNWTVQSLSLPITNNTIQLVFVDANGDGLPDAVGNGVTPDDVQAYMNTGLDFAPGLTAVAAVPPLDQWPAMGAATPIDINNDGRQDLIVQIWRSSEMYPEWAVLLATGSTANPFKLVLQPFGSQVVIVYTTWTTVPSHSSLFSPRTLDADGDGATDVMFYGIGSGFTLWHNSFGNEDALLSITEGANARVATDLKFVPDVRFSYGTLRDAAMTAAGGPAGETDATNEGLLYLSRWDAANTCTYPRRCVVGPRRVVSGFTLNNGMDGKRNYDVKYRDGRSESGGRGFLGFGARIVIDRETGAGDASFYDNLHHNGFGEYPGAERVATERQWTPAAATDPARKRVDIRVTSSSWFFRVIDHPG
ncbi:MAG: VCBS repeat-containing protein, partial [Kofleriaceae bacterium]